MTRITRGGLMVVAAAMTVTVSACGHVWDSDRALSAAEITAHYQAAFATGGGSGPALDDVTDRDAADRSIPDCRARATRADSCDGADPDSNDAATERTPAAGDAATR